MSGTQCQSNSFSKEFSPIKQKKKASVWNDTSLEIGWQSVLCVFMLMYIVMLMDMFMVMTILMSMSMNWALAISYAKGFRLFVRVPSFQHHLEIRIKVLLLHSSLCSQSGLQSWYAIVITRWDEYWKASPQENGTYWGLDLIDLYPWLQPIRIGDPMCLIQSSSFSEKSFFFGLISDKQFM